LGSDQETIEQVIESNKSLRVTILNKHRVWRLKQLEYPFRNIIDCSYPPLGFLAIFQERWGALIHRKACVFCWE